MLCGTLSLCEKWKRESDCLIKISKKELLRAKGTVSDLDIAN